MPHLRLDLPRQACLLGVVDVAFEFGDQPVLRLGVNRHVLGEAVAQRGDRRSRAVDVTVDDLLDAASDRI
nr:hypothetical protein [Micromonospora sp. DSM 115978]